MFMSVLVSHNNRKASFQSEIYSIWSHSTLQVSTLFKYTIYTTLIWVTLDNYVSHILNWTPYLFALILKFDTIIEVTSELILDNDFNKILQDPVFH